MGSACCRPWRATRRHGLVHPSSWRSGSSGPRRPARGSCPGVPWWTGCSARRGCRSSVSSPRPATASRPCSRSGAGARAAAWDGCRSTGATTTRWCSCTYVAVALDRVEPIDPGVFRALASPGPSVVAAVVPRLVSAVAAMTDPVVLVLDHLESLENRECLDAVNELAIGLPAGSQLALAARRPPRLPLALLRAQGQMVEVGVAELAMDHGGGPGPAGGDRCRAVRRGHDGAGRADRRVAGGAVPGRAGPQGRRPPPERRGRVHRGRPVRRRLPVARSCWPSSRRSRSPS